MLFPNKTKINTHYNKMHQFTCIRPKTKNAYDVLTLCQHQYYGQVYASDRPSTF